MVKDIRQHESPFKIDTRVELKLERTLAAEIGKIILSTDTTNAVLRAVGHQLRSLAEINDE